MKKKVRKTSFVWITYYFRNIIIFVDTILNEKENNFDLICIRDFEKILQL